MFGVTLDKEKNKMPSKPGDAIVGAPVWVKWSSDEMSRFKVLNRLASGGRGGGGRIGDDNECGSTGGATAKRLKGKGNRTKIKKGIRAGDSRNKPTMLDKEMKDDERRTNGQEGDGRKTVFTGECLFMESRGSVCDHAVVASSQRQG